MHQGPGGGQPIEKEECQLGGLRERHLRHRERDGIGWSTTQPGGKGDGPSASDFRTRWFSRGDRGVPKSHVPMQEETQPQDVPNHENTRWPTVLDQL